MYEDSQRDMAKVTFEKGQPIQALSGTAGNLTFRTQNGRTFVCVRPEPTLPKNPTREQKARFKKRTIIDNCLKILQGEIADIQEAIRLRHTIRDRLVYLYDKFAPNIKATTKLQKAIMSEYRQKFSSTLSRLERD
jgi:hypothetical protein